MTKRLEFRLLRTDKAYDSLNFMNCVFERKTLPMKFYSFENNTLECDIFFPTQLGWYYLGSIQKSSDGNLIISKGDHLILSGYPPSPGYSKISLKIFIPPSYELKSLKYLCQ